MPHRRRGAVRAAPAALLPPCPVRLPRGPGRGTKHLPAGLRAQFRAGSNLSAWLYKLAYHACVDGLRARRRQLFASPPPERGTDYIGPELRAALEGLSPQERGLVFSRVMEGMCYEELSEVYGASPAALRKRYERAKKKLARSLAGAKAGKEEAS